MSLREFEALIAEKPALEWVGGVAVQKPPGTMGRGRILGRVARRLDEHSDTAGGDAVISVHTWFSVPGDPRYLVPDVQYYAPGKPTGGRRRRALPPTLAVEVLQPDFEFPDALRAKCRFMRAGGVDVCWLLDLDSRALEVFDFNNDGAVFQGRWLTSVHVPGFALDLEELWALLDA